MINYREIVLTQATSANADMERNTAETNAFIAGTYLNRVDKTESYVPDSERTVILPTRLQVGRFERYEGGVKEGKFHGHGELHVPGGWKFVGQFKNGYLDGSATVVSPTGERQESKWQMGFQRHLGSEPRAAARQESAKTEQKPPMAQVSRVSISQSGISQSTSAIVTEKCTNVTDSVSVCAFSKVKVSSTTGPSVSYGANVKVDDKEVAALWVGAATQPAFRSKTAVVLGAGSSSAAADPTLPIEVSQTLSSSSVHRVTTSVSTKGAAIEVALDPSLIKRK